MLNILDLLLVKPLSGFILQFTSNKKYWFIHDYFIIRCLNNLNFFLFYFSILYPEIFYIQGLQQSIRIVK